MNIFVYVFSSKEKLTVSLCSQKAARLGGNPLTSHVLPSPELLAPPSLLANGGVKAEPAASDCYTSNKNLSAHWGRGTTLHMFVPLKRYIYYTHTHIYALYMSSQWLSGKESTCQCRRCRRHGFIPWDRKIPWKRAWQPTPVFFRILWTEEPGRLQSMGSQRVGHDWAAKHTPCYTYTYYNHIKKDSKLINEHIIC